MDTEIVEPDDPSFFSKEVKTVKKESEKRSAMFLIQNHYGNSVWCQQDTSQIGPQSDKV